MPQLSLSLEVELLLWSRDYACAPENIDGQCSIVVKVPKGQAWLIFPSDQKIKITPDIIEVFTEKGPILSVRCAMGHRPGNNPLEPYVYFDVSRAKDRQLVELLTLQTQLKYFIVDESLQIVGTKEIPWSKGRQTKAKKLLSKLAKG